MTVHLEETLAVLQTRIPAWHGKELKYQVLSGGITNRNYRIDAGGDAYVLCRFAPETELLGIDRDREYACSRIAEDLGVGAPVVWYDSVGGVLVTRFVAGTHLSAEAAALPGTIGRIAETIRTVHGGPPFPGRFSPFEMARGYHRSASRRGMEFPRRLQPCFAILERTEAALAAGNAQGVADAGEDASFLRPCHNDLLGGNLIDDGRAIRVLDWEYAAMGDPFFDLGCFALNLELDERACIHLLDCYFGEATEYRHARLKLMGVASHLRDGFWGLLQASISDLEIDFAAYGEDHLERCLTLAGQPDFARWLPRASQPRR